MGKLLRIVATIIFIFTVLSLLVLDKINQSFNPTRDDYLPPLDQPTLNTFDSLAIATRVHFQQNSEISDIMLKSYGNKLTLLCNQVMKYSNLLFIAIDSEYSQEIKQLFNPIINAYNSLKIEYIIISPWIGYTTALNAIIRYISIHYKQITYLSFQSLEISQLSPKIMHILMNQYMDNNTLVCGPQLYTEIINNTNNTITGSNIPWNTLNIWNLQKLKLFGFSLVSDGIFKDIEGGIEEVVTISLIQYINGAKTNKCKLINFHDVNKYIKWNTNFYSDNRHKYHKNKIQSKTQRAQQQMSKFKYLPLGTCAHIIHVI